MKTIVCIASGPSLTDADCEAVRLSGLDTIAINTSWKAARFAKYIYAGDSRWWAENIEEIDIDAAKWTCLENAAIQFKINHHRGFRGVENSGLRAIQFAIWRGAERVILLGYDCSLKNGIHWHGEHTKTYNPNAERVKKWHRQFANADLSGVDVVNCSRYTELECFRRSTLETELCVQ